MLRGLMGLAPQIYDSLESLANVVNEGYVYTKSEMTIIQTQYNHMAKKLNNLGSFLGQTTKLHDLPITELDDGTFKISPDRINAIHDVALRFMDILENRLRSEIVPFIVEKFFTSEKSLDKILDSTSEDKVPHTFREFDRKMIEAVVWTNKFEKYSKYVTDESVGIESSKTIIIDKLINDTILALSRIYPDRIICPTEYFWILPQSDFEWTVPDKLAQFRYAKLFKDDFGNRKLFISWSEKTKEMMLKYQKVYEFSVSVSLSVSDKYDGSHINMYCLNQRHVVKNVDALELCIEGFVKPDYFPDDKDVSVSGLRLIAELKSRYIKSHDVSDLHKMDIRTFNYGNLLKNGDYELMDPVFSIQSIIHNTIGSAQYTIQTTVTLFEVWLMLLYKGNTNFERAFKNRYSKISTRINYMSFSSISNCLVAERYFKGDQNMSELSDYMDRFIQDLEFMRRYIFKSKEGVFALDAVVKV